MCFFILTKPLAKTETNRFNDSSTNRFNETFIHSKIALCVKDKTDMFNVQIYV